MAFIKKHIIVIVVLFLLTSVRLTLIDRGHRFDLDEDRYANAVHAVREISAGNWGAAAQWIFLAQARPGFVLISMVPAAIQYSLWKTGKMDVFSLRSFDLNAALNVLVLLINGILFYRILLLTGVSCSLASAGTLIYSLLVNTNVYLRHLFPYDWSLLFFLISICVVLKSGVHGRLSVRAACGAGLLCAWGVLIYPGYISLALAMAVLVMAAAKWNASRLFAYCGAAMLVFLVTEIFSQAAGMSYVGDLSALSQTVTHGSFDEGLNFIVNYAMDVEGTAGLLLLLFLPLYLFIYARLDGSPVRVLIVALVVICVGHAILGVMYQKFVFYGRTLHMYFPFIVAACIRLLSLVHDSLLRRGLVLVLTAFAVIGFASFLKDYRMIIYPRDQLYRHLKDVPDERIIHLPLVDKNAGKFAAVVVNGEAYPDLDTVKTDVPEVLPGMSLIMRAVHPLAFPAYAFEHYGREDRDFLKNNPLVMQISVRPEEMKSFRPNGAMRTALDNAYCPPELKERILRLNRQAVRN